jgi:hypothetical protein
MPAVSKQQLKYMAGVASGSIKNPSLSPNKAKEFVTGVDYKSLPKYHKLKKYFKGSK